MDNAWVSDIQGALSAAVVAEFFHLWEIISKVRLYPRVKDSIVWRFAANGRYSAQSAYENLLQGKTVFDPYERIWKSWAPGRCKFFMWLVTLNRCWTADRLARRNLDHPVHCPLCDQDTETINHLLLSCFFAREFWFLLFKSFGLQSLAPQQDDCSFMRWWEQISTRVEVSMRKGVNSLVVWGLGAYGSTAIVRCLMGLLPTCLLCCVLRGRKCSPGA